MRFENQLPRASSSLTLAVGDAETASGQKSVRRSIRTWMSGLVALIGDGLTDYGEGMYPSFFASGEDAFLPYLRETRQPADTFRSREMPDDIRDEVAWRGGTAESGMTGPFEPDDMARAKEPSADAPTSGAWGMSALGRIWSGLCRARARRRTRLKLEALDDQTLKDIGISRNQIDYFASHENRPW